MRLVSGEVTRYTNAERRRPMITTPACSICNKRKPRRFCPGVGGDICPICCGTERENTVSCPLSCPYLAEARKFERPPEVNESDFPHPEIRVSEAFLRDAEPLLILFSSAIAAHAGAHNAYDNDVKEALASLVQSWKSLDSGLVYESRPTNPIAASIVEGVREAVDQMHAKLSEQGARVPNSDLLKVFAFLQRLEIQHNNRRPKGRAFIHLLFAFMPPDSAERKQDNQDGSSLIITP